MFLKDQVSIFFFLCTSFSMVVIFLLFLQLLTYVCLILIFFEKDFGYVERIFVIRFLNELGSQWTIVDENGRLHEITYNMDIHYPKLTRGWSNFRRCYDLDSRKLFVLKFVGNSSFQVMFAKESSSDFRVAKFLNKVALYSPLTTSPLIHFEVRLSKFNCEASHLVRYFAFFTSFILI